MLSRKDALRWCVDNLEVWPQGEYVVIEGKPYGWDWLRNDDKISFRLEEVNGLNIIFNNHWRIASQADMLTPQSDSESVFADANATKACKVAGEIIDDAIANMHKPSNDHGAKNPSHYNHFGIDDIEIIAGMSTVDEWRGFCRGSWMKYRLRMGAKDAIEQELFKSNNYIELFDEYKHLCRGVR